MSCRLNLEYCTRSCGCANCIYNYSPYVPLMIPKEQEETFKSVEQQRMLNFREKILPKAVVPIISDTIKGCGFFTKKHFVTCGHCLDNGPIRIKVGTEYYVFSKENAVTFETIDKNSSKRQTGDIAIFECSGQEEYLKIANVITGVDILSDFILPSYTYSVEKNNDSNSIFSERIEKYDFRLENFTDACLILEKVNENSNSYVSCFFEAYTDSIINEGFSGSPLLDRNNNVVGILIGCLNPNKSPHIILFGLMGGYSYLLNDHCSGI